MCYFVAKNILRALYEVGVHYNLDLCRQLVYFKCANKLECLRLRETQDITVWQKLSVYWILQDGVISRLKSVNDHKNIQILKLCNCYSKFNIMSKLEMFQDGTDINLKRCHSLH